MNVIIPMAGHSRRFERAGYKHPKAFLDINGKPMIQRVCQMFDERDNFYLVVQKKHYDVEAYRTIMKSAAPRVTIVPIDDHELGPVFSALKVDDRIDDTEPVIVSYCDFYQDWNYNQFLMQVEGHAGGIATFRGFQPASFGDTYYAYLRSNGQMEMLELREKQSFTENRHQEHASTGVYYISEWKTFKKYGNYILENDLKVGNEYYASLIYNPMVQDGLKVTLFEVRRFICWGTPEDLDQYLFWSDFFQKDVSNLKSRGFTA